MKYKIEIRALIATLEIVNSGGGGGGNPKVGSFTEWLTGLAAVTL